MAGMLVSNQFQATTVLAVCDKALVRVMCLVWFGVCVCVCVCIGQIGTQVSIAYIHMVIQAYARMRTIRTIRARSHARTHTIYFKKSLPYLIFPQPLPPSPRCSVMS